MNEWIGGDAQRIALRRITGFFLFSFVGLMVGYLAAQPSMFRFLIAAAVIFILLSIIFLRPVAALFAMMFLLPFLAFFRRALIPISGWSGLDPLLLIVPSVILMLGLGIFLRKYLIHKEPLTHHTKLFILIQYFLILSILQIFNPIQGSLLAGLGGVLFFVVPIVWMVAAREYFTQQHISFLLASIYITGILSAIYGQIQISYGFTSFEQRWIEITDIASIMIDDQVRPFSFYASAQEYAFYLVVSIIIAWVYILKANMLIKAVALISLPLLIYALLMTGTRTPVVLLIISIFMITVVNVKSRKNRAVVAIIFALLIVAGFTAMSSMPILNHSFISRQVMGLTNPFDEQHSTLGLHWDLFVQGMLEGIRTPIGNGLGVATQAGSKLGGLSINSEYDISDVMLSHGIFGGVLYLFIIVKVIRLAFSIRRDSPLNLTVLGILLGTLLFWLIGEMYSVSAIIWVLIGYLDKVTKDHRLNAPGQSAVLASK